MREALDILGQQIRSLNNCLKDKEWASTGSKFHLQCRVEYTKRRDECIEAIGIINNHIQLEIFQKKISPEDKAWIDKFNKHVF